MKLSKSTSRRTSTRCHWGSKQPLAKPLRAVGVTMTSSLSGCAPHARESCCRPSAPRGKAHGRGKLIGRRRPRQDNRRSKPSGQSSRPLCGNKAPCQLIRGQGKYIPQWLLAPSWMCREALQEHEPPDERKVPRGIKANPREASPSRRSNYDKLTQRVRPS